jgi:hypothetical protein
MYWVSLTIAGVVCLLIIIVYLFHARASGVRSDLIRAVATELGCSFHGDSFRGRFLARAVRGDGLDTLPRPGMSAKAGRFDNAMVTMLMGAVTAVKSIGGALRSTARETRVVRLRIELCAQGQPVPDGPRVAAVIRNELKGRIGQGASPEVTTVGGTELAVILRGDAATPATARWLVERAVAAAGECPVDGGATKDDS